MISFGKATLHELDTVYGVQDLHDLIEIIAVDNLNERIAYDEAERGTKRH